MTENNIEPPILGKSVTLKQLNISKFSVFVWCSLLLDKLDFLSDFLKLALRILMVSPILELTVGVCYFFFFCGQVNGRYTTGGAYYISK
jgi:hypothetical protein